ncbi:MAG: cysteine peptidase family C39 domain-containing protein [Acidobacteriota bacterium]
MSLAARRKALATRLHGKLQDSAWADSRFGRWASGWLRRWILPKAVSTPTVLQMEALECGAASLAIILAHFDRWIPLEQLRVDCGVSRDGSKASNVLKAARRHGLKAKGFKTEPATLRKVPPPLIIHWNFNHFLVLEGFHRGKVKINDPASGPRQITEDELDESFTGVAMQFQPGDDFEPGGEAPRLLPALGRRLKGSRAGLLFVLLAGLALVVPGMVAPVFSKVFVDGVLLRGNQAWMPALLLGMAVTGIFLAALTWIQQTYLLRLETKMALSASGRFLHHVLHLPMEFFSQRMVGDISGRVAANNRVAQLLSRDLATAVLGSVLVIFYLALMIRFDVVLTLVGIVVASLNVLALRLVARRRTDGSRNLLQEQGKLNGTAYSGLANIETLKAMGGESDLFQRWSGYQTKVVNNRQDLEQ